MVALISQQVDVTDMKSGGPLSDNIKDSAKSKHLSRKKSSSLVETLKLNANSTVEKEVLIPELLNMIDQLRVIGIAGDFKLPELVLCGAQNAGKSSIIHALTGLELPRAEGMCTRCEIELQTRNCKEGEQSCSVFLLQDGRTIEFGKDLIGASFDGPTVTRRIEYATKAVRYDGVLTPDVVDNFVAGKAESMNDSRLKALVRHKVIIKIQSPALADLSFCDLPGLIENNAITQDVNPEDIRSLVRAKINNSNSIIVHAVSLESDRASVTSISLVEKADPLKGRTITVLTKHDRANKDNSASLEKDLKQDFFCTKWADMNNRSWKAKAKASRANLVATGFTFDDEFDYFNAAAKTREWLYLQSYGEQIGMRRLQQYVKSKLFYACQAELPRIRSDVETQLNPCNMEIAGMSSDQNYMMQFCRLENIMDEKLRIRTQGLELSTCSDETPYITEFVEANRNLKEELRSFQPQILVAEDRMKTDSIASKFDKSNRISVQGIGQALKRIRGLHLPGEVPPELLKSFIRDCMQPWKEVVDRYYFKMSAAYLNMLKETCDATFSRCQYHKKIKIWVALDRCAKARLHHFRQSIVEYLESLEFLVWSQNEHYMELEITRQREALAEFCRNPTNCASGSGNSASGPVMLCNQRLRNTKGYDAAVTDPFEGKVLEMEIMAKVIAYYRAIYKITFDSVPRLFAYHVHRPSATLFSTDVSRELGLHLATQNRNYRNIAEELLSESPEAVMRRKKTIERQAKLQQMLDLMDEYESRIAGL